MLGRLKNLLSGQRKRDADCGVHAPDRPSEFKVGDRVSVRLDDRNRTPHVGEVRAVIWHFKDAKYNYYLSERGKKVHKRYFAEDLEQLAADKES